MIGFFVGSGFVVLLYVYIRLGDVLDELRELNRSVKKRGYINE